MKAGAGKTGTKLSFELKCDILEHKLLKMQRSLRLPLGYSTLSKHSSIATLLDLVLVTVGVTVGDSLKTSRDATVRLLLTVG